MRQHSFRLTHRLALPREEAVSQALALATRQHVRAWFAAGGVDFVLLGTVKSDGAYVRVTGGGDIPRPRAAKAYLRSEQRLVKTS
jgi:hypothetical protein